MVLTGQYKMEVAETVIRMVSAYFQINPHVVVKPRYNLEETEAFCSEDDGQYEIEVSTEFMKKCTERELVEIIAHEMVHVKQHEVDGLEMEVNRVRFRGETFTDEEYWFSPWEIEARGYEKAFWALYTEVWYCFGEDYVQRRRS